MKAVRKGVFETNSSSTHSLTICTEEQYEKWENGEVYYDRWNNEFITLNEKIKKIKQEDWYDCETEEEWKEAAMEGLFTADDYRYDDWLEFYERCFITPSGDRMVAFGKYGRNA